MVPRVLSGHTLAALVALQLDRLRGLERAALERGSKAGAAVFDGTGVRTSAVPGGEVGFLGGGVHGVNMHA